MAISKMSSVQQCVAPYPVLRNFTISHPCLSLSLVRPVLGPSPPSPPMSPAGGPWFHLNPLRSRRLQDDCGCGLILDSSSVIPRPRSLLTLFVSSRPTRRLKRCSRTSLEGLPMSSQISALRYSRPTISMLPLRSNISQTLRLRHLRGLVAVTVCSSTRASSTFRNLRCAWISCGIIMTRPSLDIAVSPGLSN